MSAARTESGADQRRAKRYRIRTPATLIRGRGEVPVLTEDVSFRGAFFSTTDPPALRQLVKIRMTVPPARQEILLVAMVVRVTPAGTGRSPGFGVQLYGLDGELRKTWEDFVRFASELASRERSPTPPPMAIEEEEVVEVKLALRSASVLQALYQRDLSRGWVALETELDLGVGTRVRFELVHPDRRDQYAIDGVVQKRLEKGTSRGLRIALAPLTDEQDLDLQRFVGLAS